MSKIINILATQLANVLNLIRAQQKFQQGESPSPSTGILCNQFGTELASTLLQLGPLVGCCMQPVACLNGCCSLMAILRA